MYSPSLQGLLVQANAEELDRAVQTYNHSRDVTRPAAAPLSTLINRVLRRQS